MTRTTPADGTPALIADQLTRDAAQDRDLRRLRRGVAVAVAGAALALVCAIALLLRPSAPSPSQLATSPAVHVACPAAPACPAIPSCAACPACLPPAAPRSRRRD